MHFAFTDEQEQFRASVQRFLRERSPITAVRSAMETTLGYDRALWRQLCDELGLPGIQVPEALGGQGFGFVELCIALEEMGRALLCAPFFASSVLATQALLNGASEAQQLELLPAIASGQRIGTLAWVESNGRWDPGGIALTATPVGAGYRLDGEKKFVLDGDHAEVILVAARAPGSVGAAGLSLLMVEAEAPGLERHPLQTLDATRRQAALRFNGVSARLLGEAGNGGAALALTLDQAAVALASEMVGGTAALLDSAVAYAKIRMQFGRPIGSFQAIKHQCAELLLAQELTAAAARYAAAAVAENAPDVPALAALAKARASDTYVQAAVECIQIHGGVGFTWDHDAHLWFKRAKTSQVLLGDANYHRERYLAQLEACA